MISVRDNEGLEPPLESCSINSINNTSSFTLNNISREKYVFLNLIQFQKYWIPIEIFLFSEWQLPSVRHFEKTCVLSAAKSTDLCVDQDRSETEKTQN